jgi:hypothetical protein
VREDLKSSRRDAAAFSVHRARLAGAAVLGLAALAFWAGRMAGIW